MSDAAYPTITAIDLHELVGCEACGDFRGNDIMVVGARGGPYLMSEQEWIRYVAICKVRAGIFAEEVAR